MGLFSNGSALNTNINSTATTLKGYSSNPISSLINTVSIGAVFLTSIPAIFYGIMDS